MELFHPYLLSSFLEWRAQMDCKRSTGHNIHYCDKVFEKSFQKLELHVSTIVRKWALPV